MHFVDKIAKVQINQGHNKLIFVTDETFGLLRQETVIPTIAVAICFPVSQSKNDAWLMLFMQKHRLYNKWPVIFVE